jgi:hypothetical protein
MLVGELLYKDTLWILSKEGRILEMKLYKALFWFRLVDWV